MTFFTICWSTTTQLPLIKSIGTDGLVHSLIKGQTSTVQDQRLYGDLEIALSLITLHCADFNMSQPMGPGHPNSNITDFHGNPDRRSNAPGQSSFLNFGGVRRPAKQQQTVAAMNQTTGPSPLHQGFHGAGASTGTTPVLHDFSHGSGQRADGVAGDDQQHFTVDVPNGSGGRDRYHLYPNGDNTVKQGGQMVHHPGENSYAIQNMHQYGQGVNQIPAGYQGAVEDHGLPHPAGGEEEEGYGEEGEEPEGGEEEPEEPAGEEEEHEGEDEEPEEEA